MATSLQTKVLYNPKVNGLPNVLTHFPNKEVTHRNTVENPEIHRKAATKTDAVPFTRKTYSRFTINLIGAAFILLACEATIYFHSVQVQKNSNLVQGKIIEMKEQDYRLNVELAKAKELTKVEKIALTDLQMKPSLNAKINYIDPPEQVTNKEYLITKVYPEERKLSINIGY